MHRIFPMLQKNFFAFLIRCGVVKKFLHFALWLVKKATEVNFDWILKGIKFLKNFFFFEGKKCILESKNRDFQQKILL